MVVYVLKYDIRPEKAEAFVKWATESAIPRILKAPGLVEILNSYCRGRTGAQHAHVPMAHRQ